MGAVNQEIGFLSSNPSSFPVLRAASCLIFISDETLTLAKATRVFS